MAWLQNVYTSIPRNAPSFMIGASVKTIHFQDPNPGYAQHVYKKVPTTRGLTRQVYSMYLWDLNYRLFYQGSRPANKSDSILK